MAMQRRRQEPLGFPFGRSWGFEALEPRNPPGSLFTSPFGFSPLGLLDEPGTGRTAPAPLSKQVAGSGRRFTDPAATSIVPAPAVPEALRTDPAHRPATPANVPSVVQDVAAPPFAGGSNRFQTDLFNPFDTVPEAAPHRPLGSSSSPPADAG